MASNRAIETDHTSSEPPLFHHYHVDKIYQKVFKTQKTSFNQTFTFSIIWLIFLAVATGTLAPLRSAQARFVTVAAGERVILSTFYEVDLHTCRHWARPNLWLTEQSTIGRAHIPGTDAVITVPQCSTQKVPVSQVIYQAPSSEADKADRLAYSAPFQKLDRNHTRTIDLVIQPWARRRPPEPDTSS